MTFDELYRAERDRMVRVAWLITGSQQTAEDLVHDAFVRIGERFDALRSPAAYLGTAVVNACRNEARRTRRLSAAPVPDVPVDLAAPDASLFAVLQALEQRQRAAIVLRYVDDRHDDEIATLLGVRRSTVRSLVARGLAAMRVAMEQEEMRP